MITEPIAAGEGNAVRIVGNAETWRALKEWHDG